MRTKADTLTAFEMYADMIRRICLYHLKNELDSEDIFQTVFLKYMQDNTVFLTEEHRKAWFIRVTINSCKDWLRYIFRHSAVSLEEVYEETTVNCEQKYVLEAVMRLPDKYKDIIYLHYYEGYSAVEIAKMLNRKENTVYSLLSRGREKLKIILEGEGCE